MFRHQKELQFEAKPDRPNPINHEISAGADRRPIWRDECSYAVPVPRLELPRRRKYKDMLMDTDNRRNRPRRNVGDNGCSFD